MNTFFSWRVLKMLLISGILILVLNACQKKEDYPDTPQIEFLNFTKIQNGSSIDNKGILSLYFTDGDGNIGLAEGDTNAPFNVGSPYYYNFYINYYEKQKGNLVLVALPSPQHARIPPIVGTGDNKPTKGTLDIELFINNYSSPYDTILFEAWIYDRNLNQSNIIRTPEIIIRK